MEIKQKEFEKLFLFTFSALLLVYGFFFLMLPQSWSLNNDYGQVKMFLEGTFGTWDQAVTTFKDRISLEGRFIFVDSFLTPFKFNYFPLSPLTIRVFQFAYLFLALGAVVSILRKFKASKLQIAFALMLITANLSLKDWLVLNASLESYASAFFLTGIAFYLWDRKTLGIIFYILSFFSKESFVFVGPTFLLIEYFNYKKSKRVNYAPIAIICVISLAFVGYLARLPRTYTAGHFNSFPIKSIFIGLVVPPIKCFGLAILFVAYNFWRTGFKKLSSANFEIAAIGACIVLFMSVFLSFWGLYDAWGYLHLLIPFGWALILCAFLEKVNLKDKVAMALGYSVIAFSLIFTVRGSLSRWQSLAEARTAADIACEDAARVPGLKVFSNCEEGAVQLQNYLTVYNKGCGTPPKIEYLANGLPSDLKAPYEIIFAKKWCNTNGDEFNSVATTSRHHLNIWSVYKNLNK